MADPAHSLDVSTAPVMVEWVDLEGRARYLSTRSESRFPVTFSIAFDASISSAFMKLRVPFFTKSNPKEDTSVFVFIPPERVSNITTEQPDVVPVDVKEELGAGVIRVRLTMKESADFVVPMHETVPKNKVNGDILCIGRLLARAISLTLYVAELSEDQLRPVCDAVSLDGVRSIEQHANLTALYFGKGGRICTDADGLVPAELFLTWRKTP